MSAWVFFRPVDSQSKWDMDTSSRAWPSITRLVAIVAVVIALVLGLNLGRQATVVYRLRREEARLEQAVVEEKATATALETREAYVQSDEFVEEWARTVAKLTQPGEVRVVILGEGQQSTEPLGLDLEVHRLQEEEPLPYWQQWWELFFGPIDPNPQQSGFD